MTPLLCATASRTTSHVDNASASRPRFRSADDRSGSSIRRPPWATNEKSRRGSESASWGRYQHGAGRFRALRFHRFSLAHARADKQSTACKATLTLQIAPWCPCLERAQSAHLVGAGQGPLGCRKQGRHERRHRYRLNHRDRGAEPWFAAGASRDSANAGPSGLSVSWASGRLDGAGELSPPIAQVRERRRRQRGLPRSARATAR